MVLASNRTVTLFICRHCESYGGKAPSPPSPEHSPIINFMLKTGTLRELAKLDRDYCAEGTSARVYCWECDSFFNWRTSSQAATTVWHVLGILLLRQMWPLGSRLLRGPSLTHWNKFHIFILSLGCFLNSHIHYFSGTHFLPSIIYYHLEAESDIKQMFLARLLLLQLHFTQSATEAELAFPTLLIYLPPQFANPIVRFPQYLWAVAVPWFHRENVNMIHE